MVDGFINGDNMILVTLGTQDKKFYRLLEAIDKLIESGYIRDKVIVQAGYSSDYKSNNMEIFDLIPMDDFNELIKKCKILITHGGVGSITAGLKNEKKVIAIARLKSYKEHTNDHQLQIVNNFSNNGYIIKIDDPEELIEALLKAKKFKPKKYVSNQDNFANLVKEKIDDYI